MRAALGIALLPAGAGCAGTSEPEDAVIEAPAVEPAASAECRPSERMVRDACTRLGESDACAAVGDVCVRLCDEAASCANASDRLRRLSPWPVAPHGDCVPCLD